MPIDDSEGENVGGKKIDFYATNEQEMEKERRIGGRKGRVEEGRGMGGRVGWQEGGGLWQEG